MNALFFGIPVGGIPLREAKIFAVNSTAAGYHLSENPNRNKPQVPAKRDLAEISGQQGADTPAASGHLPQTTTIDSGERIQLAREEGYDPLAIELALEPSTSRYVDKIQLLVLTVAAIALVIFFFPADRFFKTRPKDIGTMTIGGPTSEAESTRFDNRNQPWFGKLLEIDRLYFGEGKLTEAIRVAKSALEIVPREEWESWRKVHYRYWELLSAAGRVHTLKTACQEYLQIMPEDAFANYYYAQAFLAAANRVQSFSPQTKETYRQQAQSIIRQIENACNTLNAQRAHPGAKEKESILKELYQRLRLEQARLFVLIWKLGGYKEDNHSDVAYRDKALGICDSEELSDMKEAAELKINIYRHILDRWYWFEGQQVIGGKKFRRKELEQRISALGKEIRNTE